MSEMDERFRALADFMEWVDPEGYAEVLADSDDPRFSPDHVREEKADD